MCHDLQCRPKVMWTIKNIFRSNNFLSCELSTVVRRNDSCVISCTNRTFVPHLHWVESRNFLYILRWCTANLTFLWIIFFINFSQSITARSLKFIIILHSKGKMKNRMVGYFFFYLFKSALLILSFHLHKERWYVDQLLFRETPHD